MITVLTKWEPPCYLWGRSRSGGLLQNTSCVLPFRSAIKQLFNFAPSKISLVTLCGCRQRVTRPSVGETTSTIQNSRKCQKPTARRNPQCQNKKEVVNAKNRNSNEKNQIKNQKKLQINPSALKSLHYHYAEHSNAQEKSSPAKLVLDGCLQ